MAKEKKNYILFKFTKYYGDTNYSWKPTYYSKGGLVHQIALTETYSEDSRIRNNLVESMEDIEARYKYVNSTYSWLGGYFRQIHNYYIAKVNSGVIKKVEISELNELIDAEIVRIRAEREKSRLKREAEKRCESYTFRRGPVPGVHKPHWHRGCYYRHPLTTGSRKEAIYVDDDYKFIDIKAKKLPNVYDDLYRHNDKSWKTSCKVRKQWMKHVRKHVDTVDYNRKEYNLEFLDD